MSKIFEQTLRQGKYINGQTKDVHEKMLSLISHKGNAS